MSSWSFLLIVVEEGLTFLELPYLFQIPMSNKWGNRSESSLKFEELKTRGEFTNGKVKSLPGEWAGFSRMSMEMSQSKSSEQSPVNGDNYIIFIDCLYFSYLNLCFT